MLHYECQGMTMKIHSFFYGLLTIISLFGAYIGYQSLTFGHMQTNIFADYECNDEIHVLDGYPDGTYTSFWDGGFEREHLVTGLGFDDANIFDDYLSDSYYSSILIECMPFGDDTYITLVYPTITSDWRAQIIHIHDGDYTIHNFTPHFRGRAYSVDSSNTILNDFNQNGLPEFTAWGLSGGSSLTTTVWMMEHQSDNEFVDLTTNMLPEISYSEITDWNVDGIVDIINFNDIWITGMFGPVADFKTIYSWNGQTYSRIRIETNRFMITHDSLYNVRNNVVCPEAGTAIGYQNDWTQPAYFMSATMFASLYYSHYMHDDLVGTWELVNDYVDWMVASCEDNIAFQEFLEEMEIVRAYFEGLDADE